MRYKGVNIMIGRFQPITKGHLKCIKYMWDNYGVPTIILMIETKKLDSKHPFPSNVLMDIYRDMFKSSKMIEDIYLVKNADIVVNHKFILSKGYEAHSWVCGTDRYDTYKKMVDKYSDLAKLPEDFKLVEIKRTDEDESATKARKFLKEGNKKEFYNIFPDQPSRLDVYSILKDWIDRG